MSPHTCRRSTGAVACGATIQCQGTRRCAPGAVRPVWPPPKQAYVTPCTSSRATTGSGPACAHGGIKRWGAANSPSLFRHRRGRLTPGMPPCSQLYKDEPLRARSLRVLDRHPPPAGARGWAPQDRTKGWTKGQKSLFPRPGRMHGTVVSICSWLLVEPNILEAPIVIDRILLQYETIQVGVPTRRRAIVGDN